MTGREGEIVTREIEDGQWEAHLKDNRDDLWLGATEQEAREKALKNSIEKKISNPNDPAPVVTQKIEARVNRLIAKELKSTIVHGGVACTHVAYREDNPEVQHYGQDVTSAKKAFLEAERQAEIDAPIFKNP